LAANIRYATTTILARYVFRKGAVGNFYGTTEVKNAPAILEVELPPV
jgi:hypothetical protein